MITEFNAGSVNILIVDDDVAARLANKELCDQVRPSDFMIAVHEAESLAEAKTLLDQISFHIVLLDYDLGTDILGKRVTSMPFIDDIRSQQPDAKIYMVTGNSSLSNAVMAIRKGAEGYLLKGCDEESAELRRHELGRAIRQARNTVIQRVIDNQLNAKEYDFVATSPAMRLLEGRLKSFSEIDRPVLILGETGLGKGVIAKRINRLRALALKQPSRPLLQMNMAAISKDLAMTELFGHEPNAFTGAASNGKIGLFEAANNGDLFLDEIGELSLELQGALLKVLEEREFVRVGGTKPVRTSARVICATNRDLWSMVQDGKFREDLYMRLAGFVLELPPMSQRKEDIPLIVQNILTRICRDAKCEAIDFDDLPTDFIEHLLNDPIPGNIRGIENEINHLIFFSPRDRTNRPLLESWKAVIGRRRFKAAKQSSDCLKWEDFKRLKTDFLSGDFPGIDKAVAEFELKLLGEAASKYRLNRHRAKALKVSESTLWCKYDRLAQKSKKGLDGETHGTEITN